MKKSMNLEFWSSRHYNEKRKKKLKILDFYGCGSFCSVETWSAQPCTSVDRLPDATVASIQPSYGFRIVSAPCPPIP